MFLTSQRLTSTVSTRPRLLLASLSPFLFFSSLRSPSSMNFVRQISSHLLSTPSSSSSSSASSPSPSVLTDDCSGCSVPCSIHPSLPSYLKINGGNLSHSVKPHRRHVVISQGIPSSDWPHEVTEMRGSYIALAASLIDEAEKSCGYDVRVSLCSEQMKEEKEEEKEEEEKLMEEEERTKRRKERQERREESADIYLFPDMILFPSVTRTSLPLWVKAVFVEDRGRWKLREQHGKIEVEKAAEEEEERRKEALDLEFEYELIEGSAFLICSHKQRDKRCGIAGPMISQEFQKEIKEREEERERSLQIRDQTGEGYVPPTLTSVKVLQVSHFGGHKYAGNVIVYPPGVWLGRINPCHVHVMLDAYASPGLEKAREERAKLEGNHLRGEVQLEW